MSWRRLSVLSRADCTSGCLAIDMFAYFEPKCSLHQSAHASIGSGMQAVGPLASGSQTCSRVAANIRELVVKVF